VHSPRSTGFILEKQRLRSSPRGPLVGSSTMSSTPFDVATSKGQGADVKSTGQDTLTLRSEPINIAPLDLPPMDEPTLEERKASIREHIIMHYGKDGRELGYLQEMRFTPFISAYPCNLSQITANKPSRGHS
jgi:hypothetical protein